MGAWGAMEKMYSNIEHAERLKSSPQQTWDGTSWEEKVKELFQR